MYSSKSSVELTTLYYSLVSFLALNCMTDHQSKTTYEYNTYIVLPLNCVPRRT